MEPVTARSLRLWRDREVLRALVVDPNDGIVAIAGVVEGVLGAGLGNRAAATAVLLATIAGGIALTPSHLRVPTTFFAVTIGLALTSVVVARWGDVPLGRTVARNVAIGLTSMAVAFAVGSLVEA